MISLLLVVLLANGAAIVLRRRYHQDVWRSVNVAFAALVLSASVFLVLLSLFLIFDTMEAKQSAESDIRILYAALLLFGLSLASFLRLFLPKLTRGTAIAVPPVRNLG